MRLLSAIIEFLEWKRPSLTDSSLRGIDRDLRQFCLYVRNPDLNQLRVEDISNYLNDLLQFGWSPNSLTYKATAISQFLKFWQKRGYPVINPDLVPKIRKEHKVPRVATHEQVKQLLNAIPKKTKNSLHLRNRALISFLRDTGCRAGEAVRVNVSDLNWETRSVLIRTEKTRGSTPMRELVWWPETTQVLRDWLVARERLLDNCPKPENPEALFVGCRGWQTGKRMTGHSVGIALRKVSKLAGIPYINPHSLRHLFGEDMAKNGYNNSTISQALGHASINSSRIYTMLNSPDLKKALNKFLRIRRG